VKYLPKIVVILLNIFARSYHLGMRNPKIGSVRNQEPKTTKNSPLKPIFSKRIATQKKGSNFSS
jgi:hypothetical protein